MARVFTHLIGNPGLRSSRLCRRNSVSLEQGLCFASGRGHHAVTAFLRYFNFKSVHWCATQFHGRVRASRLVLKYSTNAWIGQAANQQHSGHTRANVASAFILSARSSSAASLSSHLVHHSLQGCRYPLCRLYREKHKGHCFVPNQKARFTILTTYNWTLTSGATTQS